MGWAGPLAANAIAGVPAAVRAAAPPPPPPPRPSPLAGPLAANARYGYHPSAVRAAAPAARAAPARPVGHVAFTGGSYRSGVAAAAAKQQQNIAQSQASQAQKTDQLARLARVVATSMRGSGLGGEAYNLPPMASRIAQTASQLGFNQAAIAGLIGNATQESSLNASLNEGTGKGLFSWDPTTNPSEATKVQLGNVDQQIRQVAATLGPGGIRAMNAAGGPEAAATWFEQNFEKADPAQANMARRTGAARQAYGQGVSYAPAGMGTVGRALRGLEPGVPRRPLGPQAKPPTAAQQAPLGIMGVPRQGELNYGWGSPSGKGFHGLAGSLVGRRPQITGRPATRYQKSQSGLEGIFRV